MAETNRKNKLKTPENPVRKMDGHSHSPQQELLELLKSKCPEAFTEGKIDAAKLKQTLGEELETNNERYGLTWAGKSECFHHIQETTTATLKPIPAESVDFDTTENIFIEGDNLEVLKILQKTYQNKIKMIYIDPPYNTGNDSFIYPDRFKEEKEDYEQRAGIKDAEGLLTKDGFWRKNSKDAGHFHSNWLSMMYPRLFLAKNLLREDGVIFVSIDDNEVHNLRMIMNEIFGEENFISIFVRKRRMSTGMRGEPVSPDHEYIVALARNIESVRLFGIQKKESDFPLEDDKGKYRSTDLTVGMTKDMRPNQFYAIKHPKTKKQYFPPETRVWRFQESTMLQYITEGNIIWPDDQSENGKMTRPRFKTRFDPEKTIDKTIPVSTWIAANQAEFADLNLESDKFGIRAGMNQEATKELRDLFGIQTVDYPKPVSLLKRFCELATCSEDIVLDFFAGSCTTAHAVMQLNAKDGGNRKFICVQLPEPCDPDSEAYKAGFRTVADIGKERIRRAAKKIEKEIEGNLKFDKNRPDLGFKVFRLDQSNFKQWRENVKTGEELKEQMRMFVDNVKKGAASEDMLFEIILKNSRFDLNVKVEKQSFDGVDYYRLATEDPSTTLRAGSEGTENLKKTKSNSGNEIVCLAPKITKKFIDKVLSEKPEKFTCLDIAFKNNDQLKTNTALQMEAAKIEFKVI